MRKFVGISFGMLLFAGNLWARSPESKERVAQPTGTEQNGNPQPASSDFSKEFACGRAIAKSDLSYIYVKNYLLTDDLFIFPGKRGIYAMSPDGATFNSTPVASYKAGKSQNSVVIEDIKKRKTEIQYTEFLDIKGLIEIEKWGPAEAKGKALVPGAESKKAAIANDHLTQNAFVDFADMALHVIPERFVASSEAGKVWNDDDVNEDLREIVCACERITAVKDAVKTLRESWFGRERIPKDMKCGGNFASL